MKLRLCSVLFIFLFSCFAFMGTAQAAEDSAICAGFSAEQEADWNQREPAQPGVFRLGAAWLVFRKESKKANSFRNDKRAHCYIGCRVTQDVDAMTAVYIGWLKEKRDLLDCNPNTHFDPLDEAATRRGSELAGQNEDCAQACKEAFGRK